MAEERYWGKVRRSLSRRRLLTAAAASAAALGLAAQPLRSRWPRQTSPGVPHVPAVSGDQPGPAATAASSAQATVTAARPISSDPDAVRRENARLGTPAWRITNGAIAGEIQGYANRVSLNAGESIDFHVSTQRQGTSYRIDFYRMGWYGGAGARLMSSATGLSGEAQGFYTGPNGLIGCSRRIADPTTGLLDVHWNPSYRLNVPNTWLSGVYLALLTDKSGKGAYVPFVVRQDGRVSDLVFKASFNTYQAYNAWGGKSLYADNSVGANTVGGSPGAVKVSFNRPYDSDYGSGEFLRYEYNLLRWIEQMGYDVSYIADGDIAEDGARLLNHRGFISAGHDEYWTGAQRHNVERARDFGVHLAFLSGDAVYWQARHEPGALGNANRTLIVYRSDIDPVCKSEPSRATVRWVDPPLSRPQHMLTGTVYAGQTEPFTQDWVVQDTNSWLFAGTGLHAGDHVRGLIGKEFDRAPTNMLLPPGLQILSHSPVTVPPVDRPPDIHYAETTVYTAPSGAIVFSAGTVTWGWGLDNASFPLGALHNTPVSPAIQRMTQNLLDRFVSGTVGPT